VLTEEFAEQLQSLYGISVAGGIAPLERLAHLDAEGMELAATLRQRVAYLETSIPDSGDATKAAIDRLTREQAFTVLNRLAAIRMAEKRGLIAESVGQQYQSKGFKVFESVAGSAIGDTYDRYRCYLFCLFDELAIDLGSLFDRRSPQALLFPRETSLLALLDLLDASDLQDLWAEDETIGWIYQYYNDDTERKKMRDESLAPRNSHELAVRNQFFTPRYVVEFLTDNTLGRIWYEMTQGVTALKEQCRYLVRRPTEIFLQAGESAPEQPAQDGLSQEELLKQPVYIPHRPLKDPRTILMLDPACGSMHFGLYAFDLFEAIYHEAWEIATGSDAAAKSGEAFAPFCPFAASFADKAAFLREVPRMIVEHNLHGIDIDPRAAQIAGLSLWLRAQRAWHAAGMKPIARPRITRSNIVCAEPMPGDKVLLAEFVEQQFPEGERAAFGFLLEKVFDRMTLAGEAGSLLNIEEEIRTAIAEAKKLWEKEPAFNQTMLFGGGDDAPEVTHKTLDLSGITDELFWEGAEEQIYAALRNYAEQAESGGFQRRLFAEDAARGFAFIDVCRKRYEAVLMNPPFGVASIASREYLQHAYPYGWVDLYACFLSRAAHLAETGRSGAITSRSFLSSKKLQRLRETLLVPHIELLADLGKGVMDAANVEAAAYSFCSEPCSDHIWAVNLINQHTRDEALAAAVVATPGTQVYRPKRSVLLRLPNARLLYALSPRFISLLQLGVRLEPSIATVRCGLTTFDDTRFLRARWEVPSESIGRGIYWEHFEKGGEYENYYGDIHLVINRRADAAELASVNQRVNGQTAQSRQASTYYYRAGLYYTDRSQRGFAARVLPQGCVIAGNAPAILSESSISPHYLLGWVNSRTMRSLVEMPAIDNKFVPGFVKTLPWVEPTADIKEQVERAAISLVDIHRQYIDRDETAAWFSRPPLPAPTETLNEAAARYSSDFDADCARVRELQATISAAIEQLYDAADVAVFADAILERDVNSEVTFHGMTAAEITKRLMLYLVGVKYGRWDIACASAKFRSDEASDHFSTLPPAPPGGLRNDQQAYAREVDSRRFCEKARHGVDIAWDGILVDDPGHARDIERCVRAALAIIVGDRAEAIEHEACALLGVPTLRSWFRKPANFFADHLKRYSKSRRQAPIYWPLSTKSGSYTLWIYYHRLNDQTLHKCLADFVDPKIKDVENELGKLTGKDSGRAADLRDFLNELKDLRDELERVIKLPWKPNLNDGVLITASPLWKLFRLSKWQKDLKACWEELEKGDYDWAHLAYTIWPERVEKVCEKDRSIAIAHGLEHLCKVEPPKPKKPRGKKASS
jgi:hypothetical protein